MTRDELRDALDAIGNDPWPGDFPVVFSDGRKVAELVMEVAAGDVSRPSRIVLYPQPQTKETP